MINEFLDAVTSSVASQVSALCKDVEKHPGRFTEEELVRVATKSRAVRVAVEDILEVKVSGMGKKSYRLLMAAFIICSDKAGPDRTESAIEIAEKLISVLPRNRWDSQDYQPVLEASINAQNLYNGEINRKGVAMWAVTWHQTINGQ